MHEKIKSMIATGENITTEFKECKDTCPKNAFESVCSFLNRYGGDLLLDNFSPFPKNPAIARVFKEIGRVEELGSGIKNIKKYCKIYSDSKPVFLEGDVFKTVIKIKEAVKMPIKADKKPITSSEKVIEYLQENECMNETVLRNLQR